MQLRSIRSIDFNALSAYVDKQARWVREAASAGAQLLVFPEYGAMEYAGAAGEAAAADLQTSLQAVSDAFAVMDAAHADLARTHGVHIVSASGPTADGVGGYVNRARLFTPSGTVGHQDKLIMTPFEVNWGITAGQENRVFETALGRISIAICYDSEFPAAGARASRGWCRCYRYSVVHRIHEWAINGCGRPRWRAHSRMAA